jgi:hypothetical protein
VGDPNAPPLNQAQLLRTLIHHQVDFILVGGAASNAHGATRVTTDLDIVVRWTTDNLERVARVLAELSARLKVPGLREPIDAPLDARMLTKMELSTWRTVAGDLDVISHLPHGKRGYLQYEALAARAEHVILYELHVAIATLDDIIVSKETVGRTPDHEALPELYRLQAERTVAEAESRDPPAQPRNQPETGRQRQAGVLRPRSRQDREPDLGL